MAEANGHTLPLSLARRVTCDFLHVSMSVPAVTIQKEMNVSDLVAARRIAQPRPSWSSIFTKAYGKVVAARPDLRRAFLTFPWERAYQYTATSADIVVEARMGNEDVIVPLPINAPDSCALLEIDRRLAAGKEKPLEQVRRYKRAIALARFPTYLRRWVWWYLLNASGYKRSRYFATYGVTSVGNWGIDSVRPLAPWSSLLHYGAINPQGNITIRLTYDHRLLDGSGPAAALKEMERVLQTDILAELRALQGEQLKAG